MIEYHLLQYFVSIVSPKSTFYDRCKRSLGLQLGNGKITDDLLNDADNASFHKAGWIPSSQSNSPWIKVIQLSLM